MRAPHPQTGVTLIEVALAVVIGMLIVIGGTSFYMAARRDANVQASVEYARKIALAAERYRRQVATSTINPYGATYVPVTYTHNADLTDASVSVLNTALGDNLPLITPFGTTYLVTTTATSAHVDFEVPLPGMSPPGTLQLSTDATSTDLRVGTNPVPQGQLRMRARAIKRNVYGEVSR